MLTGRMSPLVGMEGVAPGSGNTQGDALVKALIAAIAAGSGSLDGSMTLIPPTLYHIIITGQSNGQGQGEIYVDSPPGGFMFAGGIAPGSSGLGSIVQLEEGTGDVTGQTVSTSLVNWLKAFALPPNAIVLVSNVAYGGYGYGSLKKGTTPYNNSIAHVAAGKAAADALSTSFKVLGVVCIHGEFDDAQQNSSYRTQLAEWALDYDTDIKAITGQAEMIRLYAASQHGYPPEQYNYGSATLAGASALNLLRAAQDTDRVIMVGPQSYFNLTDGLHISGASQAVLGEQFGHAIKQTFFDEVPFLPLHISAGVRAGSTIVLTCHVPVPPIRFDYRWCGFKKNKGFTFKDSNDNITISNVAITDDDEITITLSGEPTGSNKQIRYQTSTFSSTGSEARIGRAGNLIDSEERPSALGAAWPEFPNFATSSLIPVD